MTNKKEIIASIIIIGNEVLSGRTKDLNTSTLSIWLNSIGISVQEVRVIPDVEKKIIDTVNDLRNRFDYVFTTGGIGPTHDDITADCIAAAFETEINIREDAFKLLECYYLTQNIDFNNSRQRMARIPNGAKLIDNPISVAPGFQLKNVFVMAGVPTIFQSMVQSVIPSLISGKPLLSKSVRISRGEGEIAAALKKIASEHENLSIGSYPYKDGGKIGTNIVVRGVDRNELKAVAEKLKSKLL